MNDASKTISDDFSNGCDDAPTSPPEVPAGARKLPIDTPATVYAPTSDKKPFYPDLVSVIKSQRSFDHLGNI